MINFSKNGLKISYPDAFKMEDGLKGRSPYIGLVDKKTKGELNVIVGFIEENFEHTYKVRFDPERYSNSPNIEIIRAGDYPGFPGAKEILIKKFVAVSSSTWFSWSILVPVGNRVVKLSVSIGNNEADIYNIWQPIVESIKFDPARIGLQSDEPDIASHNWVKMSVLKKSKHFQHTFNPENAMVCFYDSVVDFMPEFDFDTDAFSKKIIKHDQQVTLCPSDALDIAIDFYLNTELPDASEPAWAHVVEGIIAVDSGRLYLSADIIPEAEVVMKKGNYKFRAYFGQVDADNDSENLSIYFWPTKEKETNEVKVIKQGPEACSR